MKTLLSVLLTVLLTASAAVAQQAPAKGAKSTQQLQVKTSAVCDMCKARLEKSLAYEKAVQGVVLDVPSQMLTVTFRPDKTTPEALRTAVQRTGYDADAQPADTRAYDRLPDCCKKTNAVH